MILLVKKTVCTHQKIKSTRLFSPSNIVPTNANTKHIKLRLS